MKGSIHIRVGHAAEEFRVTFAQDTRIGSRVLAQGGSIGLEYVVIRPPFLVFLFDSNKGVPFLGLYLLVSATAK